jgi:hypothetical protein
MPKTYRQEIKQKLREAGLKKQIKDVDLHHSGKIKLILNGVEKLFDTPELLIEFLKQT